MKNIPSPSKYGKYSKYAIASPTEVILPVLVEFPKYPAWKYTYNRRLVWFGLVCCEKHAEFGNKTMVFSGIILVPPRLFFYGNDSTWKKNLLAQVAERCTNVQKCGFKSLIGIRNILKCMISHRKTQVSRENMTCTERNWITGDSGRRITRHGCPSPSITHFGSGKWNSASRNGLKMHDFP